MGRNVKDSEFFQMSTDVSDQETAITGEGETSSESRMSHEGGNNDKDSSFSMNPDISSTPPEPDMNPDAGKAEAPSDPPAGLQLESNEDKGDTPPAETDSQVENASHDAPKENSMNDAEGRDKPTRIGDRLIEQGFITKDQLEVALHEQKKAGGMLGETLVELGFVTSDILTTLIAEKTGYDEFDPTKAAIDPDALKLLNKAEALRFQVLPVSLIDGVATFAMADPYDVMALDRLRQIIPKNTSIKPLICSPAILSDAIDRAYGYASSIDDIMSELAGNEVDLQGIEELTDDNAYSHPIVRLVNALVIDAVKMGASDIHFEPEEGFVRLRFRVDGVLKTIQTIHKEYWAAMSQRLKIISGMNIADKLLPQDGRFYLSVGGREADFRVSSLPTVNGENFVLRVLDKQSGIMPLEKLGFSDHNMNLIRKSQARPEGIIIVTGPTGSGKTTSLYSMLNAVNTPDVNIMTLEDPVEYSLPMIRQTHVRGGAGLNFADGVKALLRQDPDIIFVGEVRDEVTAEQALKAAMTGHQVYTTLHTNDCFGAIPRLLDLGLQPGMLAGAIIASFAQRLVRRLCECKEMSPATDEECRLLGFDPNNPPVIGHAKGCKKCENTGYKGRTAVVEILFMNEALDDVIAAGANKTELKQTAIEHGFKSMLDDGVDKILKGMTDLKALMKSVDFSDRL